MVTATVILALSGIMAPGPLAARSRYHRSHAAPVEETATKPREVASQVPLPQPRPAEAPPRAAAEAAKGKNAAAKGDAKDSGKEEAAGPPPPSACRLALTDEIAVAPSIPPIHGPGACGGDDLVRLEAVVLPDKTRVALTPPGIMRCTMATAIVNWIRNDVAPEVAKLGSEIKALDNFESYECRGRNGDGSTRLSEHGRANAIDVHGFKLADGRMIELTDRSQPREFREAVLRSACTRFPTVLGPDSDWHHEDHIHLDLIERRSNYRICQWDVLDPMPKVAPLLPEVRPNDAPPREVAQTAGAQDKAKDQAAGKTGAGVGEAKTAADHKPDDQAAGKTDVAVGKDRSELAKPTSPAPQPRAVSAAGADKAKGESKPAAESRPDSRATTNTAAADKAPADRAAKPSASAGKAPTEKAAPEKSSSDEAASEKAPAKASRKKVAAEKPRHPRHRARMWNPFAGFF